MRFIALIFLFIVGFASLPNSGNAQWVKEDDTSRIWLNAGIYLSDSSFFSNTPDLLWADFSQDNWRKKDSLERRRILVGIGIPDYYNGNIRIKTRFAYGVDSAGKERFVGLDEVFAITVLGTPHINISESVNENFIKVTMQGVISYVQYYRRITDPFSVSAGTLYNEPRETSEYIEEIVDFEAKEIVRKTRGNLEDILERDQDLNSQFQNEKRNYATLMKYIKAYNNKHQFQFE